LLRDFSFRFSKQTHIYSKNTVFFKPWVPETINSPAFCWVSCDLNTVSEDKLINRPKGSILQVFPVQGPRQFFLSVPSVITRCFSSDQIISMYSKHSLRFMHTSVKTHKLKSDVCHLVTLGFLTTHSLKSAGNIPHLRKAVYCGNYVIFKEFCRKNFQSRMPFSARFMCSRTFPG